MSTALEKFQQMPSTAPTFPRLAQDEGAAEDLPIDAGGKVWTCLNSFATDVDGDFPNDVGTLWRQAYLSNLEHKRWLAGEQQRGWIIGPKSADPLYFAIATGPAIVKSDPLQTNELSPLILYVGTTAASGTVHQPQAWPRNDAPSPGSTVGRPHPIDRLVAELNELRTLQQGWDGEDAAAPSQGAITEAIAFIRLAGKQSEILEPTLHADGSVILEIGDGSVGNLRFKGDGRIIYAIRGHNPGSAQFTQIFIPTEISSALASL